MRSRSASRCVATVLALVALVVVLTTLAIATTANAQNARAYTSAPSFAWTFDTNVTSQPQYNGSSYTYLSSYNDHNGVIKLNGVNDQVLLNTHRDDSNNLFSTAWVGGNLTFETWALWSSFGSYSRVFDLAGWRGADDDNLMLGNQATWNDLMFEVRAGSLSNGTLLGRSYLQANEWVHIVVTVTQLSSAPNDAMHVIYLNGWRVLSQVGSLPLRVQRPSSYIGRSNWAADARFNGYIDSLLIYNYPLDDEAVLVHIMLPRVPVFELTFGFDPRPIVGLSAEVAQYEWSAGTGPFGVVTLNGMANQFIDLNSATSTSSVGTVVPRIGGDGWPAASAEWKGWTFEVTFRPTLTSTCASVFDLSTRSASSGADRVALRYTASGGLYFEVTNSRLNTNAQVTVFSTTPLNVWHHVVVVAKFATGSETTNTFIAYVNSTQVASVSATAWIDAVNRPSAFLGPNSFAGSIDNFRIYDYALNSHRVWTVYSSVSRAYPAASSRRRLRRLLMN